MIFDYQSEFDFKFAGINASTNKIEIGHRNSQGWVIDSDANMTLKSREDYDVLLSINGLTATLVVNNAELVSYAYEPRVDETGFLYGLNNGMVCVGAKKTRAARSTML